MELEIPKETYGFRMISLVIANSYPKFTMITKISKNSSVRIEVLMSSAEVTSSLFR